MSPMTLVTGSTRGAFVRFDDAHDWPTPDEWALLDAGMTADRKLVYFIESIASGLIKVGISNDPWRRMFEFGCDRSTRMLAVEAGGRAREWHIHQEFRRYSMENVEGFNRWPEANISGGTEWFMPAPALLEYIGGTA